MAGPTNRLVVRLITAVHRAVYRATGGKLGGRMGKAPILLLTTTGRRTGKARTTPLMYGRDGQDWIVVASNGGRSSHPQWWPNLVKGKRAIVQIGKQQNNVVATEVEGDERERLWAEMVSIYPGYASYQEQTSRSIPVVRLHPD